MKIKRFAALFMAATILFTNYAFDLPARAADEDDLKLSYDSTYKPDDLTLQSTIIAGNEVKVYAYNTKNFAMKDGLRVYLGADQVFDKQNEYFKITKDASSTSSSDIFTVQSLSQKDNNNNEIKYPSTYYTLKADYYAYKKSASVQQITGDSSKSIGEFYTEGAQLSVSDNSYAVLKYNDKGQFELIPDKKNPGIFAKWDLDRIGIVRETTGTATTQQMFELEVVVDKVAQDTRRFIFKPNAYHWVKMVDDKEVDAQPGEEGAYKNPNMQPGDEFQLIFSFGTTPEASLTVLHQRVPLEQAVDEAKNQKLPNGDKIAPDDYVLMQGIGNNFRYITGSVKLRSYIVKYDERINLKWEFVPDQESGEAGKAIKQPSNDYGKEWNEWDYTRPAEENVTGVLKVTAEYNDPSFYPITNNDELKKVTREIEVQIMGLGTSASIIRKRYSMGKETNQSYPEAEWELPEMLSMDLYHGEVASYPAPKYPYSIDLEIDAGKGNSVAKSMTVSSENSDCLSAIITKKDGTLVEYNFGTPFEIDANNSPFLFTINAKTKDTSTVLDFQFFNDANGTLIEDNRARKKLSVKVIDTTPDRTAEFQNISIRFEGDDLLDDYTFSPTTYTYGTERTPLVIPYKYHDKKILFTPSTINTANKDVGVYLEKMDGSGQFNVVEDEKIWKVNEKNWVDNWEDKDNENKKLPSVKNGSSFGVTFLKDEVRNTYKVTFKVRAQHPDVTQTYVIYVMLEAPSPDPTLTALNLYDREGNVYSDVKPVIAPKERKYEITVPYEVDEVRVEAIPTMEESVWEIKKPEIKSKGLLSSFLSLFKTSTEKWIDLEKDYRNRTELEIYVTAEDGITDTTYYFTIIREAPSRVATLENLVITDGAIEPKVLTMKPAFNKNLDVEDQPYEVNIPYTTDKVRIIATPTSKYSKMQIWALDENGNEIKPALMKELAADMPSTKISVPYASGTGPDLFSGLFIGAKAAEVTETTTEESTPETSGSSTSSDESSSEDETTTPDPDSSESTHTTAPDSGDETSDSTSGSETDTPEPLPDEVPGGYRIRVKVYAQDPEVDPTNYDINVIRTAPSKDTSLSTLTIAGFEAGADKTGAGTPIEFEFIPEVNSYKVKIPYEYERIKVTPTAANPNSTIKMGIRTLQSGQASPTISIDYPGTTDVEITVIAEDKKTEQTYTLSVTRNRPSSDARLKGLEVGNSSPIKPVFIASTTRYTSTVNEKAEGVTITATTNSDKATLTIDGKVAKSGVASELITLLDVKQEVEIVVTAQDRETTKTYIVRFTNENLINKTSNADLASLVVKDGVMKPKFSPSATEYEVSVKEETASIEIIPETSDPMAEMKVFNGTKEIGDDEGNYVCTLVDGANEFSVEVTSPDKSKTKKYVIMVYRNDEEHQGTLRPVTVEDLDFEYSDIITIDINKYPRIGADVFNELKKYPESQLILQGNDYSLQFSGADVTTTVPFEQVFDFGLSFSSPNKDIIEDEIYSHRGNDTLEYVIVHFDHHGALPAPATFNLSLGRRYADETLYWHYYNEERDRIDYYGKFTTNSRGTYAVTLDHLSDYIVADRRIVGSEWKDGGEVASELEEIQISQDAEEKRINPNTGAEEGGQIE